ncbi:MAG: hypothetical protein P4N59_25645 [Negativicutes bacterium]|nr:hypothetical protein [Negativicutes bacterium]
MPWYPEIIVLTAFGVLLGRDMRERVKLVIIGLVFGYLAFMGALIVLIGSGTSH